MKQLLSVLLLHVMGLHAMGSCSMGQLIEEAQKMPIDMYTFVFQRLDDGYSLLHATAKDHDVITMQYLIKMGLDVNEAYKGRQLYKTPIMVAVDVAFKYARFETLVPVLELLCKHGAIQSRDYCMQFDARCKKMNLYEDAAVKRCREILATQLEKQ